MSISLALFVAIAGRPARPVLISGANQLNPGAESTMVVDLESGRTVELPFQFCSWSSDGELKMICEDYRALPDTTQPAMLRANLSTFDSSTFGIKPFGATGTELETWNASAHVTAEVIEYGQMRVTFRDGRRRPRNIGFGFREISSARLSPDGEWVAVALGTDRPKWDHDRSPDTWIVRLDGKDPHRIGRGGLPRWSPDGKRLLVRGGSGIHTRICELTVKTLDSRVLLAEAADVLYGGAAYSPDGTRIAISRSLGDGRKELVLADGNGKTLRTLSVKAAGAVDW